MTEHAPDMTNSAEIIDLGQVRKERACAKLKSDEMPPSLVIATTIGLYFGLPAVFWMAITISALRVWRLL